MAKPKISAGDFASRTFDYLVVGGGTAGLALATRLSEDPANTVGVLEAGAAHFDEKDINVPGRYGEGIGTSYDWQYETTPQRMLGGRSLPWPRGKLLGGTSGLNFMTWNRPNREDLDAWVELGNRGWGWDDMLPFYKKSENFTKPALDHQSEHKLYYDKEVLGTGSPVSIGYQKEYSASHNLWHETLHGVGMQTNEAHFSGSNVGVWTNIVNVDDEAATRAFSTTAYYLPNAARRNLVVLTEATVQELVLEPHGSGLQATGVRFEHDGETYVAKAANDVVVCAGSVASPQILELSGIGGPSVLEAAGIPVKVANPNVGENLQDHMMTVSVYEIDPSVTTPDDLKTDPSLARAADEMYETNKSGPRTLLPVSYAYVPLSHFVPPEQLASLREQVSSRESSPKHRILSARLAEAQRLGYIEYIFDVGNWSTFMPTDETTAGKKYATLLQILQYCFSRGSIHISPRDPTGKPIIDPQYYDGEHGGLDLDIQTLCAHFGQKIVDTKPLKDFILKRAWPTPEMEDHEIKDWVVANTVTDWHPVGTCGMGGSGGIKAGVVDERLRVYGVKGCGSAMPASCLCRSAHISRQQCMPLLRRRAR